MIIGVQKGLFRGWWGLNEVDGSTLHVSSLALALSMVCRSTLIVSTRRQTRCAFPPCLSWRSCGMEEADPSQGQGGVGRGNVRDIPPAQARLQRPQRHVSLTLPVPCLSDQTPGRACSSIYITEAAVPWQPLLSSPQLSSSPSSPLLS